MKLGTINIENKADVAIIDIDGIIGIPEWWQFDNPEDKVSTYETFKDRLNEIKNLNATNIEVNIQSPGGSVSHALNIYETLKSLNGKVTTKAFGFTASAGTIVHQGGQERLMAESGLYLIHRASNVAMGNVYEMAQALKDTEKVDTQIASIYSQNSKKKGLKAEDYLKVMDRANGTGEWLTADEALELDLVDKKVTGKAITNINFSDYNLPEYKPKKNEMKIKESWNQFLNLLGVGKDTELTENHLESLNSELTNKTSEIATLKNQLTEKDSQIENLTKTVSEKDATIAEKETKITDLTNNLSTVTSERDQLKAGKTETESVEDPVDKLTGNAAAYEKDMANFKD